MRPGTLAFCRSCAHLDQAMHRQGHPSPCGRQRWIGPQLHVPTITGDSCAEFEAAEPGDSVAGDTKSPEPAAEEAMG